MNAIIDRIREKRKQKGMTHENMAHELKISQTAYSKIEKNETRLTVERLFEIAEILEVSVSELLDKNSSITYSQQEFFDNSIGHQQIENYYQENRETLANLLASKDEIIEKQQKEIEFLRELVRKGD